VRFQRINREDGEKVFVAYQNVSTETVSKGYALCVATGASPTGIKATKPATSILNLFLGIAADTTAVQVNEYGQAQVYGYCAKALLLTGTTAAANFALGVIGIPVNAQWYLNISTASVPGQDGYAYGMTTIATTTNSAATNGTVWLRAL